MTDPFSNDIDCIYVAVDVTPLEWEGDKADENFPCVCIYIYIYGLFRNWLEVGNDDIFFCTGEHVGRYAAGLGWRPGFRKVPLNMMIPFNM